MASAVVEEEDGFDFDFDFGFVILDEEDRRSFWSYERETAMRRELLEFNSTIKPCLDLIRVLFREKVIVDVAAVILV